MEDFIRAKKGKLTKKFPIETWNLLKDKNGWIPVTEESPIVINNIPIVATPPPSGSKKTLIVKNEVEKTIPVEEKKVENKIPGPFKTSPEFFEFADKEFSSSKLKDYFDGIDQPYKNSGGKKTLIDILAEKFNNDIAAVKAAFEPKQDTDLINSSDL